MVADEIKFSNQVTLYWDIFLNYLGGSNINMGDVKGQKWVRSRFRIMKCEKDSIGHSGHIGKEGQFGFCFCLQCS